MKKFVNYFPLLVILAFNLTACAQQKDNTSMTVSELRSQMHSDSLVILDVRTDEELTGPLGHIDGIVHIPLQDLKQRMHELDKFKDKQIAVVCRSGNRSNTATTFLKQNGYNARNVEGGMIEYRKTEK